MFFRNYSSANTGTETLEGIPKSLETPAAEDREKNRKDCEAAGGPPHTSYQATPSSHKASLSLSQHKTRPYIQKIKLWGYQRPQQPKPFKVFFLPIQLLFTLPAMSFSGLLVGGTLAWYNAMAGSMTLTLSNAPYNFSTTIKLARRDGGIMELEQRLWICLVGLVVHPAGCLLFGVGASYGIHWAGVVVGLGLIASTFPLGICLAYSYVQDSYKELAGEGIVSVILVRSMMGKPSLHLNIVRFHDSIN